MGKRAGKVEGSLGSRFLGSRERESDRRSGSTRRGRARAPMVVDRGGSIPIDSAGVWERLRDAYRDD